MESTENSNYKRIEFKNFKDPLKRISISALGTILGVSLYSGALVNQAYASDLENVSYSDSVVDDLPDDVRNYVLWSTSKNKDDVILESDLVNITYLGINVSNDSDLRFLRKFPNLQTLIIQSFDDNLDFLNDFADLKSLKELNLYCLSSVGVLTEDNLKFLESISLDKISLNGYCLYPGCEDMLNNVKELYVSSGNYDIDFSKLTSLEKLDLSGIEPYDLAIYFTSEDYKKLTENGVEIIFSSEKDKLIYFNANAKLDEIVKTLNIEKDSTDKDKLDAILIYVLENLKYDDEISRMLREGGYENVTGVSEFYKDGYLFGALEKDSAICGNYSSLVEALLNRVGLSDKSAFIHNKYHAWNAVNIDGEAYFVDATWLDSQTINIGSQVEEKLDDGSTIINIEFNSYDAVELLKSGKSFLLKWYMEELDDDYIKSIDDNNSHGEAFIPEYVFTDDYEFIGEDDTQSEETPALDSIPNISEKEVKIRIGKKEIIIGLGALIGVLSACGVAIKIHSKKERDRRRRRFESYRYSRDYLYEDSFQDDFLDNRRIK